jgi:autotransporter-associated beta strand protein
MNLVERANLWLRHRHHGGSTALAFATTSDFMIASGVKLQGDPIFFVDSGHTDALLGNVADASAGVDGDLVKTGAGKLVLGGDNSYTGATIVEAGTLALPGSAQNMPQHVPGSCEHRSNPMRHYHEATACHRGT